MAESRLPSVIRALNATSPDLFAIVAVFSPYLHIAHQVPGRIRFRVDVDALDDPAVVACGIGLLTDKLAAIRGVREIRFNKLARSCVVDYDRKIIADAAWADLLCGRATPAARSLTQILQDKVEEQSHGQP